MKILGIDTKIAQDSEGAVKGYSDTLGRKFKNIIWSGDANTNPWQRATSFTNIASGDYLQDRWRALINAGSGFQANASKAADSPTVANSGLYSDSCFRITDASTTFSISSSNLFYLQHPIEGYHWRTLHGKPVTLSFWVKSSKTGTYSVVIWNGSVTATYRAAYTINAANTWEKKVINIPASGGIGTWDQFTNGFGCHLSFFLMAGSSNQLAASTAWDNTGHAAVTGQANFFENAGGTFNLQFIQLEEGYNATQYEVLPINIVDRLCKRYFNRLWPKPSGTAMFFASGRIYNSGRVDFTIRLPIRMRAAPSITISSGTNHFIVDKSPSAGAYLTSLNLAANLTTESAIVGNSVTLSGMTAGNGVNLGIDQGSITFSAE